METKKYWQAVDAGGGEYLHGCKPTLINSERWDGDSVVSPLIFPIPLKPLQIAEITVCENGTWSYEIEWEEGWYMAKETGDMIFVRYKDGKWTYPSGAHANKYELTISHNRIPDECII